MKIHMLGTALVIGMLVCVGAAAAATRAEVMRRFAPVVLQRCHGRADFITRFDFDGNWNGRDNWEHLDDFPEPAYVYGSAIETTTHYYLTYSFFHPRDWWPVISLPKVNHENDMEGALVVVEKSPRPDAGLAVLLMETIAHKKVLRWSADAALEQDSVKGPVRLEGERPIVEIGGYKHATDAYTGDAVSQEDGVIYRYTGTAQVPRGKNDHEVGYELLDLEDTLWAHRNEIGPDQAYGEPADFPNGRYGSSFSGDNREHDGADAPWFWGKDDDLGLKRGEWFLDPAKAMHAHFPHAKDRFSRTYVSNPYAAPLR